MAKKQTEVTATITNIQIKLGKATAKMIVEVPAEFVSSIPMGEVVLNIEQNKKSLDL